MTRKDTKVIQIGDRVIGGGNPVLIQSTVSFYQLPPPTQKRVEESIGARG